MNLKQFDISSRCLNEYESGDEVFDFYNRFLVHCAPTLLSVKPASLYCMKPATKHFELWCAQRSQIESAYGIKSFILKETASQVVALIYNLKWLERILNSSKVELFLKELGYNGFEVETSLNQLRTNFIKGCPHELGIFLGYPLEDVKGFMTSHSECLMCGYWKVYSRPDEARRIFSLYDQTKELVKSALVSGVNPHDILKHHSGLRLKAAV